MVVGPVTDDTVGLLIRQFGRGTIDAEYMKREFDFGKLTNQYTFYTEKSMKQPMTTKEFFTKINGILKENNSLPDIRWHDLKSTYCTLLLKNDFNPKQYQN